jgi:hypothetical protein
LSRKNRNLRITGIYVLAGISLWAFFYLESTENIPELLGEFPHARSDGFEILMAYGLMKYFFLAFGAGVFVIFTFMLLKENFSFKTKN